jgi:hypothetical protein
LILSDPETDRINVTNAPDERLNECGLLQPGMKIALNLEDGNTIAASVGEITPDVYADMYWF